MGEHSRGAKLGALLIVVLFLVHASLFLGGLMDDSFIAFRYAHNLARGLGFVFNPGERVEGFTSFSWVLLSALSFQLGVLPEITMPIVGALAGATLIFVIARAGTRLSGDDNARVGIVSALLVTMSPGVAFYAVSGLEHTFFTLLLTLAALALVERRLVAWSLFNCAAFITRPEAALLGPLGLFLLVREARNESALDRTFLRKLAFPALLFTLCLAPYLGFKLWYFGALLPNTLRAKTPDTYLAAHYTFMGSLPTLALALYAFFALLRKRLPRAQRELFFIWFAYVLSVIAVGPDWMPAFRLLVPPLPCLMLVVAGPILFDTSVPPRRPLAVLAALLAVALYAAPSLLKTLDLSASTRLWPARDAVAARVAHELVQSGVERVATINIGMLAYQAPDIVFTDLAGLVDREIASGPGGHLAKHPSDAYLFARNPQLFVLTSSHPPVTADGRGNYIPDGEVERYVFARPWFMQRYSYAGSAQLGPVDFYVFFRQRR